MKLLSRVWVLFFVCCGVAFAAGNQDVKMVSYFPVPYAAYNNISASNELQLGLGKTSTTTLGSGSATQDYSLTADQAGVAAHSGTANVNINTFAAIDSSATTNGLNVGNPSTQNASAADFDSGVYVQSVTSSSAANKAVHESAKTVTASQVNLFPGKVSNSALSTTDTSNPTYCTDPLTGNRVPATWKKFQVAQNSYKWVLACGDEVTYQSICEAFTNSAGVHCAYWDSSSRSCRPKTHCMDSRCQEPTRKFTGTSGVGSSNCSYQTRTATEAGVTKSSSTMPYWIYGSWTTVTPAAPETSRYCQGTDSNYCGTQTRTRTCNQGSLTKASGGSSIYDWECHSPTNPYWTVSREWPAPSADSNECIQKPTSPTSENKACNASAVKPGKYYSNESTTNQLVDTDGHDSTVSNPTRTISYGCAEDYSKRYFTTYGAWQNVGTNCYKRYTNQTVACNTPVNSNVTGTKIGGSYTGGNATGCTKDVYHDGHIVYSGCNINECYSDTANQTVACNTVKRSDGGKIGGSYLSGNATGCTTRHYYGSSNGTNYDYLNCTTTECYNDTANQTVACNTVKRSDGGKVGGSYLEGNATGCTIRNYSGSKNGTQNDYLSCSTGECYNTTGTNQTVACNTTKRSGGTIGGSYSSSNATGCTIRNYSAAANGTKNDYLSCSINNCYYDGTNETCNCNNHGTYKLGGNVGKCTIRHFGSGSTSVQSITNINSCYYDGTNETCNCSNHGTYKLGGNVAKCTIRHFGDGTTNTVQSVTNANSCYYNSTCACGTYGVNCTTGGNVAKCNYFGSGTITLTDASACYKTGISESGACSSNCSSYPLNGNSATRTYSQYCNASGALSGSKFSYSGWNCNNCYYDSTDTGYRNCTGSGGAGYDCGPNSGSYHQRTQHNWGSGSKTYGDWGSWNNSACWNINCSTTSWTETDRRTCLSGGAGYECGATDGSYRQRTVTKTCSCDYPNGTTNNPSWGGWNNGSCWNKYTDKTCAQLGYSCGSPTATCSGSSPSGCYQTYCNKTCNDTSTTSSDCSGWAGSSNPCGTANLTRSGSCVSDCGGGYCSYGGWSYSSGCSPVYGATSSSWTQYGSCSTYCGTNCGGNNAYRTVTDYYNSSCGGAVYSSTSYGSWKCGNCYNAYCNKSCTDTSTTSSDCSGWAGSDKPCGTASLTRSASCNSDCSGGSCSYGGWSYSSGCYGTSQNQATSSYGNSCSSWGPAGYTCGSATLTRSCWATCGGGECGGWSYSSGCYPPYGGTSSSWTQYGSCSTYCGASCGGDGAYRTVTDYYSSTCSGAAYSSSSYGSWNCSNCYNVNCTTSSWLAYQNFNPCTSYVNGTHYECGGYIKHAQTCTNTCNCTYPNGNTTCDGNFGYTNWDECYNKYCDGSLTDTDTASCGTGYTGNKTRTRTRSKTCSGCSTWSSWSSWDTSNCKATCTNKWKEVYRSGTYYPYNVKVKMPAGTTWNNSYCTSGQNPMSSSIGTQVCSNQLGGLGTGHCSPSEYPCQDNRTDQSCSNTGSHAIYTNVTGWDGTASNSGTQYSLWSENYVYATVVIWHCECY